MKKFLASWAAALAVMAVAGMSSAAPLRVVTTMSTFADIVKQIGGDQVEVDYVASPRFNPHFIEPKPSDVLKVKKAALLVHGGLDLELWRGPLLTAVGNPRMMPGGDQELDLSRSIPLLEVPDRALSRAEGDQHLYGNPHYWTGPENARIIAHEICDKLKQIDPANQTSYEGNLRVFLSRLDTKEREWSAELASCKGKELIAYHNEWLYLTEYAGVKVSQFMEPKPGIPPTPKHLAFLEDYAKANHVPGVIRATYSPPEAVRTLERVAGIKDVVLCQNVKELPQAGDYFSWMDYNVKQIADAFKGGA